MVEEAVIQYNHLIQMVHREASAAAAAAALV
jgi:hypothetical protein